MLKDSTIQVSYLKDLVTLVDPTSPYSFLAYLKENKRLYRALINGLVPLRKEMEEYYQWAVNKLDCLSFGARVEDVAYDGTQFIVDVNEERYQSKNLSIGIGQKPYIPECVSHLTGPKVYHASEFLFKSQDFTNKRVVIVGGGQTSAEIVELLLEKDKCTSIDWITRRENLYPMDDSPFVNEWFLPNYVQHFYRQSEEKKKQLLAEQKLSSDGISMELLENIYRQLYINDHLSDHKIEVKIHANSELVEAYERSDYYTLFAIQNDDTVFKISADVVILCTGYQTQFPPALNGIKELFEFNKMEQFQLNEDYSLKWAGNADNKIFIHNGGKHQFGVADPNLSLMSYRSAKMINSLTGEKLYDLDNESTAFKWETNTHEEIEEIIS
jgi:lysine N6-hydroxylase